MGGRRGVCDGGLRCAFGGWLAGGALGDADSAPHGSERSSCAETASAIARARVAEGLDVRERLALMVDRVIGRRVGRGGSEGVAFLAQSALSYRVFPEIWAAGTLLVPPELCPPVADPGFYGLANE